MGERVASVQVDALLPYPEIQLALQNDHDLLVRIMGVRLVARATAGLDGRHDHLDSPTLAPGQEFIHGAEPGIGDPAPLRRPDEAAALHLHEEIRDGEPETPGDALHRGNGRRRHPSLDLGEKALGDPGSMSHFAEGQSA